MLMILDGFGINENEKGNAVKLAKTPVLDKPFKVLRVGHVGSPIAQGLSMGTATHAVGTSTAMEISGKYGAYASLGLTLNGIMTAVFTPTILKLLGVI